MEILLFGGTTEGRILADWLADGGARVTLCVATGYGEALAPSRPGVAVRTGRLDRAGMEELMASRPFACAVDATHPYAVEVSRNLAAACAAAGLPRRRLLRPVGEEAGDWLHAPDLPGAAELCKQIPGNLLLTTGAKELEPFAVDGLRERAFPRVLPSLDSLGRCLALGFPPAHILCMQGPFSAQLNAALIRQYEIAALVTKASGAAGGFGAKAEAARLAGCALVVVDRPGDADGVEMEEMKAWLSGFIS